MAFTSKQGRLAWCLLFVLPACTGVAAGSDAGSVTDGGDVPDAGSTADAGAVGGPWGPSDNCVGSDDLSFWAQGCDDDADCAFRDHGPYRHRCAYSALYEMYTCVLVDETECEMTAGCAAALVCTYDPIYARNRCVPECSDQSPCADSSGWYGSIVCFDGGCIADGCETDEQCGSTPGVRCELPDTGDGQQLCWARCEL